MTVGEKALKDGMVEWKPRIEKENRLIGLAGLTDLRSPKEFWERIENT
jgi:hypothetical protein